MSATPEPPIPLGTLREALRRAVAASSVRAVGEVVGLSHTGVRKFLDGAKPHASTVRNVTKWYLSQSAGTYLDAETATAAIELLVYGAAEPERERLRERLRDLLREAYGASGREPPEWLKESGAAQ